MFTSLSDMSFNSSIHNTIKFFVQSWCQGARLSIQVYSVTSDRLKTVSSPFPSILNETPVSETSSHQMLLLGLSLLSFNFIVFHLGASYYKLLTLLWPNGALSMFYYCLLKISPFRVKTLVISVTTNPIQWNLLLHLFYVYANTLKI